MTDEQKVPAKTYGVALELHEIDTANHTVRGIVHLDTPPFLKKGEDITVSFSFGDAGWKMVEGNLKKGQAAPVKGVSDKSLVVLENVYRDQEGKIIARWARTARSALKTLQAEDTLHDRRKVMPAWVSEPTLTFKNPNPSPQDPDYIVWPLTATTLKMLDRQSELHSYDKEWLLTRLEEARRLPDIPVTIRLYAFDLKAPTARKDLTRSQAQDAARKSLKQGQQVMLLWRHEGAASMRWIRMGDYDDLGGHYPHGGLRVVPATPIFFGTDSTTAVLDALATEGKGCPKGIQFLFVPAGTKPVHDNEMFRWNASLLVAPALLTVSEETNEKDQSGYYIQTPDLVKYLPLPPRTLGDMVLPAPRVTGTPSAVAC